MFLMVSTWLSFQSTPSARRATCRTEHQPIHQRYFNPRPPRGGRHPHCKEDITMPAISIHALREEGDFSLFTSVTLPRHFNPRPPRGGRRWLWDRP